jgi:hypothetical protein
VNRELAFDTDRSVANRGDFCHHPDSSMEQMRPDPLPMALMLYGKYGVGLELRGAGNSARSRLSARAGRGGPSPGSETWSRNGRQYEERDSAVKADAYLALLCPSFSMAPVTRRSPVWRRVADALSAVRPRWRVSQTIRNRAEPR